MPQKSPVLALLQSTLYLPRLRGASASSLPTRGHSTVQYSTVQYSTVQYSTVQYQYSTVQVLLMGV